MKICDWIRHERAIAKKTDAVLSSKIQFKIVHLLVAMFLVAVYTWLTEPAFDRGSLRTFQGMIFSAVISFGRLALPLGAITVLNGRILLSELRLKKLLAAWGTTIAAIWAISWQYRHQAPDGSPAIISAIALLTPALFIMALRLTDIGLPEFLIGATEANRNATK